MECFFRFVLVFRRLLVLQISYSASCFRGGLVVHMLYPSSFMGISCGLHRLVQRGGSFPVSSRQNQRIRRLKSYLKLQKKMQELKERKTLN